LTRKTLTIAIFLAALAVLAMAGAADRLPNQTPENQVFSIASTIEATGSYSGSQALQWTTGFDPAPGGGSDLYVYASSDETFYPMSGEDYAQFRQNLAHAGGSDESFPLVFDDGEGGTITMVFLTGLTVPKASLGLIALDSSCGTATFEEMGEFLTGDGPTRVIASHGGLHTGILDPDEVRATTAYSEMTETNGGYISETKTFDPDTRNKAAGLFNVESTKTFTYATDADTGSIAQTSEMIATDNMGAPTPTADVVACPFGPSESEVYPAFCNVVYAKSMSQGVTSAAQSSSAQVRMVAASADTPAELNYNFDVKPDASSGTGYAVGTFGTEFGVSIREGREGGTAPSATLVYTDRATVAGLVAKLSKRYSSKSGFSL
jgi:hypothetical protein